MDLNHGILYLDAVVLEHPELARVGLDHELYHWNHPEYGEERTVERTREFVGQLSESEREALVGAIEQIYGKESAAEILGDMTAAQISEGMERRRSGLIGVEGRVEYFRKRGERYWIVMDGEVEYELRGSPKRPQEYNLIRKWTDEGLDIIREMLRSRTLGEHVLLVGEAGVGKDWLALAYGELMGEDPIVLSLSEETEGQDLVAWRGLKDGLTEWEYSQIVKAYEEGKILILDEVTKTRPGARAILNELMQSSELELPDGMRKKRGAGFQRIATMNEAKEGYGGFELGEDFEDRFGAILEVRELEKGKRVEFLKKISDPHPSPLPEGEGTRGGAIPEEFIRELVEMQERINRSGKVKRRMSLRVLERIIEAIQRYPDEDIAEMIQAEYQLGEGEGREYVAERVNELSKKEWVEEKNWKEGTRLPGPNKNVFGFTWSSDGKILLSRGMGGEIFYWNYKDGKFENEKGTRLTGPNQYVLDCTWSPDGKILLSRGMGGEIFYWKLPQERSSTLSRAVSETAISFYTEPTISDEELVSGDIRIPLGSDSGYPGPSYEYLPKASPTNNKVLHQILRGISLGRNVLVVGPVGVGKSWLVKAVFRMLRRRVEHMSLHEGTTTRDLTAWPKTKRGEGGDLSTDYELSPLARAMWQNRK